MKKKIGKFIFKCAIILILFVSTILLAWIMKFPALFNNHVTLDEDFRFAAWVCLIIYRLTIYYSFPILISAFEKIFKTTKYWSLVLDNFNSQFFIYSVISGLYLIFGLDKLLGVSIFESSDTLMFLASFVFTLTLKRKIDNLPNNN